MASSLVPLVVVAVCIVGLALAAPAEEKEIARVRHNNDDTID